MYNIILVRAYEVRSIDRVIGNLLSYRYFYPYVKTRVSVSCYHSLD